MHGTDPTRYQSIVQSFLFQIQFARGATLWVVLMGEGGNRRRYELDVDLAMPFARDHARSISIAVRLCWPSSVGLHGRT